MKLRKAKLLFFRYAQDRPIHCFLAGIVFCMGVVGLILSLV